MCRVLSAAGPIAGHGPRPSPAARHQKDASAKVGPVPIVWLTAGDKSGSKSDVEDLGHAQGARPEVSRSGDRNTNEISSPLDCLVIFDQLH